MNLTPSECKQRIIDEALQSGIEKVGVATISPVDNDTCEIYRRWIAKGRHGEMHYMEKYAEVRDNPALLLPGAQTIVCCAINYLPHRKQPACVPQIASYALGLDYHEVVREKLSAIARLITELTGAQTRVCVDTAPLRERYWAMRSGLGFIGLNNQLIIPGRGSHFFLGEIITTVQLPPDEPCREHCMRCGACLRRCPAKAINPDGSIDTQRCISYLTIEYRGELPDDVNLGNRIYGCDACQDVCPHNRDAQATPIAEFEPGETLISLDLESMKNLSGERFSELFRHSAIKRTKHIGFMRNLHHLLKHRK